MSKPIYYEHPEPVPPVSQLLALPFVASISGYLVTTVKCSNVRVTLHRVMNRDGLTYLQQVCSYFGQELDHAKAGRLFVVDEGIIGKALADRRVIRTGQYTSPDAWWNDYRTDREKVGDTRPEPDEPISYIAVPFVTSGRDSVVCVLYAEAGGLNRFVNVEHLDAVLGMSTGYCKFLDGLNQKPLSRIRNYPLPTGTPVRGTSTLYSKLQEVVEDREPPQLSFLTSFNFASTI